MGRTRKIALVTMFTLGTAVCVAGFFHSEPSLEQDARAVAPVAQLSEGRSLDMVLERDNRAHSMRASIEQSFGAEPASVSNLSFGTEGRAYHRDASVSVRVNDVFDSLALIEKLVADAKGYLVSIDVNGSSTTHDGQIRLAVPSDKFTEVFGKLRQLGDVLSERITAQMATPNPRAPQADVTDESIEVVQVAVALSDNPERLAKTKVGAMMGAAWQKGMEHFAKGGAVLLEGAGYVLPFILVFVAILIVVGVFGLFARVFGRLSAGKIPYAVPAE